MSDDVGDRDAVGAGTVDHGDPATDGTAPRASDGNGETTAHGIGSRSTDGLGDVVAGRIRDHEESLARVRAVTNIDPAHTFDHDKIRRGVRLLLEGIGEDPDREGLRNTPERVAREYDEVFAGLLVEPADVISAVFSEGHDEIVMMRQIPFHSMCEHHLLPWFGHAHVAYLPSEAGRITGLSKLARVVDVCAKRPGVQERMTTMVADAIEQKLEPRGVLVVVEARHLCMEMRGIRKPGAETVTSTVRGRFRDDPKTRAEAFALLDRA